jgi:hypothetical protein
MREKTGHRATEGAHYVDTPAGLFTASGVWFNTTEEALHVYAGPVLAREPLEALLRHAEVWLRSPQTLALWVLPLFLLQWPPAGAALGALAVYVGWALVGPGLVNRPLASVFRRLDYVMLQALFYVFMLSLLAARGAIPALWVGLAGFILLRWGIVEQLTRPVVAWGGRRLYALPIADQVLRATIVRAAMHHGASLPELDRMTDHMVEIMTRNKKHKKD